MLKKLAQTTPNSSSSYPNPSDLELSEISRIPITSSSIIIGRQKEVKLLNGVS